MCSHVHFIHLMCDSMYMYVYTMQYRASVLHVAGAHVVCLVLMFCVGTGKTTTLLRFTALNPHMNFLYCVYNKYDYTPAVVSIFFSNTTLSSLSLALVFI